MSGIISDSAVQTVVLVGTSLSRSVLDSFDKAEGSFYPLPVYGCGEVKSKVQVKGRRGIQVHMQGQTIFRVALSLCLHRYVLRYTCEGVKLLASDWEEALDSSVLLAFKVLKAKCLHRFASLNALHRVTAVAGILVAASQTWRVHESCFLCTDSRRRVSVGLPRHFHHIPTTALPPQNVPPLPQHTHFYLIAQDHSRHWSFRQSLDLSGFDRSTSVE